VNLYEFDSSNPIINIDPLGLADCAALKAAIARMTGSIHGALHSMADINRMFDDAKTSAGISLTITAIFAAQSGAGLSKALTANASKTAPVVTAAAKGTLPVGVFTPSGRIALAGSFDFKYAGYTAQAARNTGMALIATKEAGSALSQEGVQDSSRAVQRILDPYGRLADVQNESGASMSEQTYQTIKDLQAALRGMKDEYQQKGCK
jgi:hypothetical protein